MMKKKIIVLILSWVLFVGCQSGQTATPVAIVSPAFTPSATATATATLTAVPSATATPTIPPTASITPTSIPTYSPTWPPITPSTPTITPTPSPPPYDVSHIPECVTPGENPEPKKHYAWQPCGDFVFSPQETWVTFQKKWHDCSYTYFLINTETGEQLTFSAFIEFWSEEVLLTYGAGCGPANMSIFNLNSRTYTHLGLLGYSHWNDERTVVMMQTGGWVYDDHIWGYNFEQERFILPASPTEFVPWEYGTVTDNFIWVPDQSHALYQSYVVTWVGTNRIIGPRTVQRVNVTTGVVTTLLGDETYSYYPYLAGNTPHLAWNGDWIEVNRVLYEALEVDFEDFRTTNFVCPYYGSGCSSEGEKFMLNWQTGELIPWEEFQGR